MIKRFFHDETGLELSEYAVAAALVALAAVAAVANAVRLIVDVVGGRIDVSALIALLVLILTGWISGVVASQFRRRPHPPWYWLAPGATRS